jgi:hypothetical protein
MNDDDEKTDPVAEVHAFAQRSAAGGYESFMVLAVSDGDFRLYTAGEGLTIRDAVGVLEQAKMAVLQSAGDDDEYEIEPEDMRS